MGFPMAYRCKKPVQIGAKNAIGKAEKEFQDKYGNPDRDHYKKPGDKHSPQVIYNPIHGSPLMIQMESRQKIADSAIKSIILIFFGIIRNGSEIKIPLQNRGIGGKSVFDPRLTAPTSPDCQSSSTSCTLR
jgi:hypothetical protein